MAAAFCLRARRRISWRLWIFFFFLCFTLLDGVTDFVLFYLSYIFFFLLFFVSCSSSLYFFYPGFVGAYFFFIFIYLFIFLLLQLFFPSVCVAPLHTIRPNRTLPLYSPFYASVTATVIFSFVK